MEAGMPLYGHELGEDINALSCGVDFAISLDKTEEGAPEAFIGQAALKKTQAEGGPKRKLAGIILEGKRTARQGMGVKIDGADAGVVTSACLSPTVGKPIAMAFIDADKTSIGRPVQIDSGRGDMFTGAIAQLPFYKAPR
jgi:aminomethyltransferase